MSALKKVELHCHLEGAAAPQLSARQAARYGVSLDGIIEDDAYAWTDFPSFLRCYDRVASLYRNEEDYALLAETYLAELAAAGTIYSELIVSPDHGDRIGLGARAYIDGVCEGIRRAASAHGIEARLIVTGERHFGRDSVIRAARFAANAGNPLITGFNLAGDETLGRVVDFAAAFDIAREAGLGLTIHAGEVCGAFSVADALHAIRPARIGHGVRAAEDPDLMRRLAASGTVLEVCPGSNIALGIYPDFARHPLRILKEAGIRVTLNSDDPPFFHTTLAREYALAETVFGFDRQEIDAMTRTAVEAAFVDEPTRQVLLSKLDS